MSSKAVFYNQKATFKGDFVTWAYEYGFRTFPRLYRKSHLSFVVDDFRDFAYYLWSRVVSYENVFRNPDCRDIEEHTHMRCKANPSGVSDSMPVNQKDIRLSFQPTYGFGYWRGLSKAQKRWDIWKSDFGFRCSSPISCISP